MARLVAEEPRVVLDYAAVVDADDLERPGASVTAARSGC